MFFRLDEEIRSNASSKSSTFINREICANRDRGLQALNSETFDANSEDSNRNLAKLIKYLTSESRANAPRVVK